MNRVNMRLSLITALAQRALALVAEWGLGPKLPATLLDTAQQDLTNLSVQSPGTDDAKTGVRALTGKQNDACQRAVRRIAAVRRAVTRQTKSLEARRAYGVGESLNARVVRDVLHALRLIVARIEAQPEEARAFGFADEQLATLRTLAVEVALADEAQENARLTRPLSTRDRNAAARRLARAIGIISDLGVFAFADDDAKRAQFEALAPKAGRPPKMPPMVQGSQGVEAPPAAGQEVGPS